MTPEERVFDGAPSSDLERWLGDVFESWVPSRRQLILRLGRHEIAVEAGTHLWAVGGGRFIVGGSRPPPMPS